MWTGFGKEYICCFWSYIQSLLSQEGHNRIPLP